MRSEQSPLEKILGHTVSLEQQKPDTWRKVAGWQPNPCGWSVGRSVADDSLAVRREETKTIQQLKHQDHHQDNNNEHKKLL